MFYETKKGIKDVKESISNCEKLIKRIDENLTKLEKLEALENEKRSGNKNKKNGNGFKKAR